MHPPLASNVGAGFLATDIEQQIFDEIIRQAITQTPTDYLTALEMATDEDRIANGKAPLKEKAADTEPKVRDTKVSTTDPESDYLSNTNVVHFWINARAVATILKSSRAMFGKTVWSALMRDESPRKANGFINAERNQCSAVLRMRNSCAAITTRVIADCVV